MQRDPLHAVTWLVWAVSAAVTVQLAPSPAYVAVVIAVAALVVEVHGRDTPLARAFPVFVAIGASFALVRVVLTTLTTHGSDSTLFVLPEATLPQLLGGFTVGGSVELSVVLQSASEGFAIVGLVAVFGAFNAVASHYELVQSAPRAFYEPGLAVTVALAFVPSTVEAVAAANLAERARTGGRVVRRGRWLRRVVPTMETGLERAVALSESMDSRGFARLPPTSGDRTAAWCGLGALLCLGGAFVALVGRASIVAGLSATGGCVLLVAAIAATSRSTRRTRYRARSLAALDWVVMGTAAAVPVTIGVLAALGEDSLRWSATPLRWPDVDPVVGITLALLALPVAFARPPATRVVPAPAVPTSADVREVAG